MKHKILFILAAVLLLLTALAAGMMEQGRDIPRYHQHLEAPPAQADFSNGGGTHLPIITIKTGGQKIPGIPLEEMNGNWVYETSENGGKTITVQFEFRDGGEGRNTLETRPEFRTSAQIRYRGNSSRHFDKKSFAIHLVDEEGGEKSFEMAGLSPHNEWVLNGPFLDRTLLRNYLCLNVAGEIMPYAPNVRYCELYLDGKFQGLYLLIEPVTRGEGRLSISKPEKNRDMTSWIVRWDRTGKGDQELDNYTYYTYQSDVSSLDVRYPGRGLVTEGRMAYINKEISAIERTLYSSDLSDSRSGCRKYLDIEAFAQYFIINEFFRNVDAGRFSTFYYKDVRGKVTPCVWDFNNACDNYSDYEWDEAGFTMQNAPWFGALLRDKTFVRTVVNEYRRLRKGALGEEYLLQYIDDTVAYLGNEVERNYQVWGYVFDPLYEDDNRAGFLQPSQRNLKSYEDAVNQLKDFLIRRGSWLDQHIETLYQYCADSKNANRIIY